MRGFSYFELKATYLSIQEIIQDLQRRLREMLGVDGSHNAESLENLSEKPEIPERYKNLFSLAPLEDSTTFVNRTDELAKLKTAYENWTISRYMALMVGEAGLGTTSLLNYIRTELHPEAIFLPDEGSLQSQSQLVKILGEALKIEGANSLEDLQKQLGTAQRVIIIENIERLFLRKIYGFNLLRDFLLFMHATKDSVYWIATINTYSYYYLRHSIDIASNFLSIIQIQYFQPKEIEKVIMQRNEGFELIYLKPVKPGRWMKWELNRAAASKRKEMARTYYFEQLHSFSKGNISRAIVFWLNSIKRFSENKIYVRAFEPKPLGQVELTELFILEAILQHTSLTTKSLDDILRQGRRSGSLVMEHLLAKGWISARETSKGAKPEYQISLMYLQEIKERMSRDLYRKI